MLDVEDVSALLGWIAHSSRNADARLLMERLGPASDNPRLLGRAMAVLDRSLFDGERLCESMAGVAADQDADQRRRRYRLLLSAFHPDRYPARNEWLTRRSQIITRAYSQFKANPDQPASTVLTPTAAHSEPPPAADKADPKLPDWLIRSLDVLRRRWGHDRYLGHKIIGALALIALLPAISVMLERTAADPELNIAPGQAGQSAGEPVAAPIVPMPVVATWPPELHGIGPLDAGAKIVDGEPMDQWRTWLDSPQAARPNWLATARLGEIALLAEANQPATVAMSRDAEVVVPVQAGPQRTPATESMTAESRNAEPTDALPMRSVEQPVPSVASADQGNLPRPAPTQAPATALPADRPGASPAGPDQIVGQIALGPLDRHPVGELLRNYQSSFEAGDVDGILALLARQPRENDRVGLDWFERHYRQLFASSSRRTLDLHVLHARRQGHQWRVTTRYRVDFDNQSAANGGQRSEEVAFVIAPDPFHLKIAAIEH